MSEEKTVYILLTRSGTWFSRLIHLVTDDCYTHASLGLDGPAGPFYSFARRYKHFALPAGLVQERVPAVHNGRQTPCCLYALKVPHPTYLRLRRRLQKMYAHREEYHYNLLGIVSCLFHRPLSRKRHYFCSQFAADLLEQCGAVELEKSPGLTRPSDFCRLPCLQTVYHGELGRLRAAVPA